MEMADTIVINKADGDNLKAAKLARNEFNRALHLYPPKASGWIPKTLMSSAIKNEGITEVWETISEYFETVKSNNYFQKKRKEQNKYWLLQTIESSLKSQFYADPEIKKELERQLLALDKNQTTPFEAADILLSLSK